MKDGTEDGEQWVSLVGGDTERASREVGGVDPMKGILPRMCPNWDMVAVGAAKG